MEAQYTTQKEILVIRRCTGMYGWCGTTNRYTVNEFIEHQFTCKNCGTQLRPHYPPSHWVETQVDDPHQYEQPIQENILIH